MIHKIYLTVIAILLVLILGFYLLWKDTESGIAKCQETYTVLFNEWNDAVEDREALGSQIGELITDRNQWKRRAEMSPAEIETVREVVVTLPPDCQQCAAEYKLDRSYYNPELKTGPDVIPEKSIVIEVEDVLGINRASWSINVSNICPECVSELPSSILTDGSADSEGRVRIALDLGIGYGYVGPEVQVGLYPLSFASRKWNVDVGGWVHAFLPESGQFQGNAVLGVRLRRLTSW